MLAQNYHIITRDYSISDQVFNEIGSIIKVENDSGKEYLRLDKENFNSASHNSKSDQSTSAGATFKLFGANLSANQIEEKFGEWKEAGKSLNEQVK